MAETHVADRFNREVDGLLSQAGRLEPEPASAEYHEMIRLAGILAGIDFSASSRTRRSLRQKLLSRVGTGPGWQQRTVHALSSLSEPRNPVLTSLAMILVAALVFTAVWPGASATLAQSITATVRELVLGKHTTVTQTVCPDEMATVSVMPQSISATPTASIWPDPAQSESRVEQDAGLCIISTVIGRFGFHLPSDNDAVARRFGTLQEAQSVVPFRLLKPGYLPESYALREVLVAPGGSSFLFYEGPRGNIILVQILVSASSCGDTEEGPAAAVQVLTGGSIEPVYLNGVAAGWVEDHGLMWEADGVSYTVGGLGLGLDEAIRIAESLG